jgi:hypothetical protein
MDGADGTVASLGYQPISPPLHPVRSHISFTYSTNVRKNINQDLNDAVTIKKHQFDLVDNNAAYEKDNQGIAFISPESLVNPISFQEKVCKADQSRNLSRPSSLCGLGYDVMAMKASVAMPVVIPARTVAPVMVAIRVRITHRKCHRKQLT